MAEVIETQLMIYDSIVKLGINLKKDSADRKTLDYFKRRLSTLANYWTEYQANNERIEMEVSKTDPYFTDRLFEKTSKAYESAKAMINQQYQLLIMKGGSLATREQQAAHYKSPVATGKTGDETTSEDAEPSVSWQLGDSLSQKLTVRLTNSKINELLKKQYANFKAFERTTANIDVDSISDKWEFEDVLKSLQSRWSVIDIEFVIMYDDI